VSERGSWVTQYIYCPECVCAVRDAIAAADADSGYAIETISAPQGPIFGGFISGPGLNGEHITFEVDMREEIESRICHPLSVAVLSDGGANLFYTLKPEHPKP